MADLEKLCQIWPQKDERGYVTQSGVPLSAVASRGDSNGDLAVVLNIERRPVLGYVRSSYLSYHIAEAAALIQSEIVDGDDDLVTWAGIPRDDGLQIKELKVHGYTIYF